MLLSFYKNLERMVKAKRLTGNKKKLTDNSEARVKFPNSALETGDRNLPHGP